MGFGTGIGRLFRGEGALPKNLAPGIIEIISKKPNDLAKIAGEVHFPTSNKEISSIVQLKPPAKPFGEMNLGNYKHGDPVPAAAVIQNPETGVFIGLPGKDTPRLLNEPPKVPKAYRIENPTGKGEQFLRPLDEVSVSPAPVLASTPAVAKPASVAPPATTQTRAEIIKKNLADSKAARESSGFQKASEDMTKVTEEAPAVNPDTKKFWTPVKIGGASVLGVGTVVGGATIAQNVGGSAATVAPAALEYVPNYLPSTTISTI